MLLPCLRAATARNKTGLMKKPVLSYPIALILIILFAGYFLYKGYLDRPQVDLAAYQRLCDQYLQASAGTYTDDQLQLLVYKINYLFPEPADKLAAPAERDLKLCAGKLSDRLKPGTEK